MAPIAAWQQTVLAIAAIVVALLLMVMGRESEGEGEAPAAELYADLPLDATLLRLDKEALDSAYRMRVQRLFDVWLTNQQASDATQFQNGLRIARKGYSLAIQQIHQRQQQILEIDQRPR